MEGLVTRSLEEKDWGKIDGLVTRSRTDGGNVGAKDEDGGKESRDDVGRDERRVGLVMFERERAGLLAELEERAGLCLKEGPGTTGLGGW